jgi:hypothetical protein
MQVQIVENWTEIVGELKGHHQSKVSEDFLTLEILVKEVKPVKGVRNLLEDAKGKTIEVNVKKDQAENLNLEEGAILHARVRRANLKNIFAHPEHLSVKQK